MSVGIQNSFAKSGHAFAEIEKFLGHKNHHHNSKYGHLDYLLHVPCKSTIPTTSLTAETLLDFEIKTTPALFLHDDASIWVQVQALEANVGIVQPTFAEAFFNRTSAIEFLMDGVSITNPKPMMEIVLKPALVMTADEFTSYCNLVNHNAALADTSPVNIAQNANKNYYVQLPNILPKGGFWLGALHDHTLTIRLRTQNAVDSGAGTLQVTSTGFQLILECITIPQSDWPGLSREWAHKKWHVQECILNEPNAVTTVATGQSPDVKLEAFKDKHISHIIVFIHASRSFTNSAYFLLIAPDEDGRFYIRTKDGSQIFTSNQEYFQFNKYVRSVRQFGSSRVMQDASLILINAAPEMQKRLHAGEYDEGKYIFDGEEVLVITDLGTAAAEFVDAIGFYDAYYEITNGVIKKAPI